MKGARIGSSLASTLLLCAIAITLAFTLAGVSFTHLSVSARLGNSQQARNLAEAAIARACEKIFLSQGKYGTAAGPPDCTVNITLGVGDVNEGQGLLTFDSAKATALKIARSTNNLAEKDPVAGVDRQVPPQAVQLLGVGRCNGVERRLEAILAVPAYRHAITSSGPFTSEGGLTILGLDTPSALAGGIQPEEERAGNLASNGSGAEAVKLDSDETNSSRITGDVRSAGAVVLGANTTVTGEIRPNSASLAIPKIEVTDYDPGDNAIVLGATPRDDDGNPIPLRIEGTVMRRQGNLDCPLGVVLDDGLLYVDGNVTIAKGVNGKGAIIATGNLILKGDGAQEGDKGLGLLAGGDLEVLGEGKSSSFTQGLAYSEGNVTIADATFVGAVVANDDNGSTVRVDRARAIHVEQELDFVFKLPFNTGVGTAGFNIQRLPKAEGGADLADYFDSRPAVNGFPDPRPWGAPGAPYLAGNKWVVELPNGQTRPLFKYTGAASNRDEANALLLAAGLPGIEEYERKAWSVGLTDGLRYAQKVWVASQDQANQDGNFSLDPSRFLQLESKTVFTLWREL